MEKMVLVEKLNEENELISKEIPVSLESLYINTGWKKVSKKVENKPVKEIKLVERNKD